MWFCFRPSSFDDILAFSPDAFLALARRSVTEPLQLAPARLTRPGLLLPSAKFSLSTCTNLSITCGSLLGRQVGHLIEWVARLQFLHVRLLQIF
jgi:hypothetical protein